MDLALTDEQRDLAAAVRRFLADTSGIAVVRSLADTDEGFDRSTWTRMATEIGLQALLVPERFDGLGQGPIEVAVVCEEMGRALYPGPFLATLAATCALVRSGDEPACAELLPGIAAGETIAAPAVAEAEGRWDAGPSTVAARRGGGWTLTGTKLFVRGPGRAITGGPGRGAGGGGVLRPGLPGRGDRDHPGARRHRFHLGSTTRISTTGAPGRASSCSAWRSGTGRRSPTGSGCSWSLDLIV